MIKVDGTEVRAFGDQLRDAPKELRRELRKSIREAAGDFVQDVKTNASWSSRIPGAVKTRVGFGARTSGVRVHVDNRAAPHARPLEFGNRGTANINRHPVFGGDTWVDQPTRPFFMPAVRANRRQVVLAVQKAIDKTLDA